jgi:alginate O-acetyltransferase complex protein AlgI
MWRWEFSLLVIFSASVDFVVGKQIYKSDRVGYRRFWLLISLIINIGLLTFFKYTYFIYDNMYSLGNAAGISMRFPQDIGIRIILPLGISFYTFQTISYSIDVYRRVVDPVRNFPVFLTYVAFWPQLVAGPILRAKEVIPQLESQRKFKIENINHGALRILMGLFKKVCLADNIALFVDTAFSMQLGSLNAFDIWTATFLFGFQIYFDFSGYSDIAIGSARMLGLHFPNNFNWPYLSASPKEFWKRWHISLSSFIRDYLYLPLTGQKYKTTSTGGLPIAISKKGNPVIGLFITWFIMGLWHGASWNFALWGIYHAFLIFLFRLIRFNRLFLYLENTPIAWGIMIFSIMAGWIPFRSHSLIQAASMLTTILDPMQYNLSGLKLDMAAHTTVAVLIVGMLIMKQLFNVYKDHYMKPVFSVPALIFFVSVMILGILIYLQPVRYFIYFQF